MKARNVYDFHKIKPQAYDLRAGKDQKKKGNIQREGKKGKGGEDDEKKKKDQDTVENVLE